MQSPRYMEGSLLIVDFLKPSRTLTRCSRMASFVPSGNRPCGEKKTKWCHSFTWTENHLSREDVGPLRHQYDELGARTLERLLAIKEERNEKGDFYKLLQKYHEEDEILSQFWGQMHHIPEWVDWAQIERGQRFFYRYALANIIGFAFQGFVCENSVRTHRPHWSSSQCLTHGRHHPAWWRSSSAQVGSPLASSGVVSSKPSNGSCKSHTVSPPSSPAERATGRRFGCDCCTRPSATASCN